MYLPTSIQVEVIRFLYALNRMILLHNDIVRTNVCMYECFNITNTLLTDYLSRMYR